MGHYNDQTLDYTGEDAFRARIAPPVPSPPTIGPIDAAVCGALERLADESANAMRLARADGDKAGRTFWQRATTSYVNALIAYRAGVRPELLASGAWLLPSRRAGEAPHIVRMDGPSAPFDAAQGSSSGQHDWVCSCRAGAAMHWSLALIIGIEVANDDLTRFDGGDEEEDGPVIRLMLVAPARPIGARLAEARRNYTYAA